MRSPSVLRRTFAVAPSSTPLVGIGAQSGPAASTPATKTADVKALQLEDFARWNRITSPALSPDGKWMTFTYSPNEGGQTILHVKALDGSKDYTVTVGGGGGGRAGGGGGGRGAAGGGKTPSFTDDSKWAAYAVTPQARGTGGAAAAPGGRGGRGRGARRRRMATSPRSRISSCSTWRPARRSRFRTRDRGSSRATRAGSR